DFDVIDRVTALYEAVWSGAECRGCRLREVCPDPILPAEAAPARKRGAPAVRLGQPRRLSRGRTRAPRGGG
ncbi:MAG TPA: phospholipase, partial [Myxococcaceae bacterium]|nr:phospholipase [Myxococcaceae bacterium]